MDRSVREREDLLERTKVGYLEKEQVLQAVNQDLQSKLEDAQIKERQMVWSHQDIVKEKDLKIEKWVVVVRLSSEQIWKIVSMYFSLTFFCLEMYSVKQW